MIARLTWASVVVGLLVTLLAGAGTASAASAGSTATLYRSNGSATGSVSLSIGDTDTLATVSLAGGRPNVTYSICIGLPMGQEQGGCSSAVSTGSLTTDATGTGTGTITLWNPGAVLVVVVTNTADPSDSDQAVVDNSAHFMEYPGC